MKYPIKEEWEHYYKALELIRQSGITNMWGGDYYLKEICPELTREQAKEILCSWIDNYNTLSKKFSWR